MGLIFGSKLRRQIHANALFFSAERGNLVAVELEAAFDRWAWALAFDVTERHTGFVHVVGRQLDRDFIAFDDADAV
jgi:hypothetical protein